MIEFRPFHRIIRPTLKIVRHKSIPLSQQLSHNNLINIDIILIASNLRNLVKPQLGITVVIVDYL